MQANLREIEAIASSKLALNTQKGLHECHLNNRTYQVFPQVFSPAIFVSSQWETNSLIKHIGDIKSFLQIGVGTGITLIEVILAKGCTFAIGTDICDNAVLNTKANLERFNLKATVIHSDVLDSVSDIFKFDAIYWNYPCICAQGSYQQLSLIDRMVKDPHYDHLQKLLKTCSKNLTPQGRVFLGFSHSSGDEKRLRQLCEGNGWEYNVLELKEAHVNGRMHSVCLLELSRRSKRC